jgi:cell division septation protein DedD
MTTRRSAGTQSANSLPHSRISRAKSSTSTTTSTSTNAPARSRSRRSLLPHPHHHHAVSGSGANNLPGPQEENRHGRDAKLFAEPLTSAPKDILRLASTAEAADADAHVAIWLAQPPRPVETFEASTASGEGDPVASAKIAAEGRQPGPTAVTAHKAEARPKGAAAAAEEMGPWLPKAEPVTVVASTKVPEPPAARPAAAKPAVAKPAATKAAVAKAKPVAKSVYTVQLGAFKTRRNAEELVVKVGKKSRTTKILQEGGLFRVVSGSFVSKKDAALHESSLKRAGYTTYVRTAVF